MPNCVNVIIVAFRLIVLKVLSIKNLKLLNPITELLFVKSIITWN